MTDPYVSMIDVVLKQRDIKRVELGRLLGLDSAQVTRIFQGKRKIQLHEAQKIDEWLNAQSPAQPNAPPGTVVALPGMIPLFGWSPGVSSKKQMFASQSIREYVHQHPAQAHIADAFALEVSDDLMAPRYEPGEFVYVAPRRWPKRGQDCLIVKSVGPAVLGRFISRSGDKVTVALLNPYKELKITLDDEADVHSIVGRN